MATPSSWATFDCKKRCAVQADGASYFTAGQVGPLASLKYRSQLWFHPSLMTVQGSFLDEKRGVEQKNVQVAPLNCLQRHNLLKCNTKAISSCFLRCLSSSPSHDYSSGAFRRLM
ncbi:hypothetical protein NC653_028927 [Populus alba x Populus x berolinensis]|uniref:Uncharacterized protein n=1 Tax=Populus alba x Populus x berolinensis TaxID=444605 RepID=A0AAD6Q2L2_9ROSI|nr:hypothetical protein NC653_028927 [Populus alba x Populus x berolinensis]